MKQRNVKSSEVAQSASHNATQKTGEKPPSLAEADRLVNSNFGALVFLTLLPFLLQYAWFSCEKFNCSDLATLEYFSQNLDFKFIVYKLFPLPSETAIKIYFSWIGVQWLMHIGVPGRIVQGHPITWDGSRLLYKINGLTTTLITLAAFFASTYLNIFDPSIVVEHFGEIVTLAHMWAYSVSLWMYLKGAIFQQGNPSGKIILDFFYGYEPNTRIFNIITTDIKFFSEGRALTGWLVVDLCLVYHQYVTIGYISSTIALITFMHAIYVIHYFVHETNVLAMMDFTADHMGWMLCWGNFVWVNFSFPMQVWVAHQNPKDPNPIILAAVFLLFSTGYTIFRQANLQKLQFRTDPTKPIWGKTPKSLKTARGTPLLLSGWWGIARKVNYTGDLLIAYSFAFGCVHFAVAALLYPGYLTVLLIHRAMRDDEWCKAKYGKDWDAYCKEVPYKLIPYVY